MIKGKDSDVCSAVQNDDSCSYDVIHTIFCSKSASHVQHLLNVASWLFAESVCFSYGSGNYKVHTRVAEKNV